VRVRVRVRVRACVCVFVIVFRILLVFTKSEKVFNFSKFSVFFCVFVKCQNAK